MPGDVQYVDDVKVISEYIERVNSGEDFYLYPVPARSIVIRITITYGMVVGVYPRVMVTVRRNGGSYTHRRVEPLRRMRAMFRRFTVPADEKFVLTFLSDDPEGVLRDINLKVEIREGSDS